MSYPFRFFVDIFEENQFDDTDIYKEISENSEEYDYEEVKITEEVEVEQIPTREDTTKKVNKKVKSTRNELFEF